MQTIGAQWRNSSYSANGGQDCVEVGSAQWRKSTYSGNGGQDCVEVGRAPWRKSSYSGNGGQNCVEAGHTTGAILVRDTKDQGTGPVLRVTPRAWKRLTTSIKG